MALPPLAAFGMAPLHHRPPAILGFSPARALLLRHPVGGATPVAGGLMFKYENPNFKKNWGHFLPSCLPLLLDPAVMIDSSFINIIINSINRFSLCRFVDEGSGGHRVLRCWFWRWLLQQLRGEPSLPWCSSFIMDRCCCSVSTAMEKSPFVSGK